MKFLFIAITVVFVLPVLSLKAAAYSIQPNSGSFDPNENGTFDVNLIAAPPSSSSAVQVRLQVNGAVASYTSPGGSILAIGTCTAENATERPSAEGYDICVDLAKSTGDITEGESLGTITLGHPSDNSVTDFAITAQADNGYFLSDASLSVISGELAGYTWTYDSNGGASPTSGASGNDGSTSPTVSVLPATAISDYMPNQGVLGIAMLVSGIISLAVAYKVFVLDKKKYLEGVEN